MADQILWGVKNGELEKVKEEFKKGAVKVNDEMNGRTALHFAADYGQIDVIEYLLNAGADIDKQDKHGITPLLSAIWESHKDAVELLLSKGANKNGKAPDGSPYIENAETDEIKVLLK